MGEPDLPRLRLRLDARLGDSEPSLVFRRLCERLLRSPGGVFDGDRLRDTTFFPLDWERLRDLWLLDRLRLTGVFRFFPADRLRDLRSFVDSERLRLFCLRLLADRERLRLWSFLVLADRDRLRLTRFFLLAERERLRLGRLLLVADRERLRLWRFLLLGDRERLSGFRLLADRDRLRLAAFGFLGVRDRLRDLRLATGLLEWESLEPRLLRREPLRDRRGDLECARRGVRDRLREADAERDRRLRLAGVGDRLRERRRLRLRLLLWREAERERRRLGERLRERLRLLLRLSGLRGNQSQRFAARFTKANKNSLSITRDDIRHYGVGRISARSFTSTSSIGFLTYHATIFC